MPAKLSLEVFSGGLPARGSGRPRRRGNPDPAKPLADRTPRLTGNCPSNHGPLYAPSAGRHRSHRRRKERDMDGRLPRANDRIGAPAGVCKPRVFNGLVVLLRIEPRFVRVFSAHFNPFLSRMVRDSP